MNYIPLRTYSVFSQGHGAVDAASLAEIMQKAGLPFLPLCDPMALVGWEKFQAEAAKRRMKPLLGTEIILPEKGSLLLFPLTQAGYFSLVSCLNRRALPVMREVLAVFLPCRPDAVFLRRLQKKIGPENFYLGLEWGSGQWLRAWSAEFAVPLVWAQALRWTGNARKYAVIRAVFQHLPLPETLNDDMGLSRQGSGRPLVGLGGCDRPLVGLDGLIPAAAIVRRWAEAGRQALANTVRLAERVNFAFAGIGELFPDGGNDLEVLVRQKLDQRRAGPAERERALQELQVIGSTGAAAYFLIAAAIADFCRQQRIFFNLRGSGASSFVLFLLGMSRVDPLAHGLLFERFVNSLRRDIPDIDIDIDSSRRREVFAWLFERYRGRAAFVSCHKFFGARAALYETARAFGLNPDEAHALTRPLPMFAEPAELSRPLAGRPLGAYSRVYRAAALLDGVFKELSLHVGGVVFSSQAVDRVLPLTRSPEGFPQLAWDKDTVERLGIFKLDLLGVRGFEVIAPLALADPKDRCPLGGLSRRLAGRPFVDLKVKADGSDADVWQRIQQARTVGCFQLESPLSRENLLRARPADLSELAIAVAIIRPGPARSGMKQDYLEKRPPRHPLLGQLFPGSRGALIFEEQITTLLHHVSGWSLEQAEMARKELKKKKGEARQEDFFERGRKNGWSQDELELFWKLATDFSLYAFCQAHSLAYAYAAFLSAWLKTRQPLDFFCRLFNAGGGYYPLPVYIEEAKKNGLTVLAPDVNGSGLGFSPEQGAIRCGLLAVKGIGAKLATCIVTRRGRGYGSFEDFMFRTRLGERDLSALLAVSALSCLGRDGFSAEEKRRNWEKYLGFQPS